MEEFIYEQHGLPRGVVGNVLGVLPLLAVVLVLVERFPYLSIIKKRSFAVLWQ
jgi:hypothetical protein